MKNVITESEWIAELERLITIDNCNDGYKTVNELIKETGHSDRWVRDRLILVKEAGRLELGYKQIRALNGRLCKITAYRIKPDDKKNKALIIY